MRRVGWIMVMALLFGACGRVADRHASGEVSTTGTTAVTPTTGTGVSTTVTTDAIPSAVSSIEQAAEVTSTAVRACAGASAGDTTVTVQSGGVDRTARVHVPSTYSGAEPVPLVLDFHGHGGTSRFTQIQHQLDPVAESSGAITVYPQGLLQLDGKFGWHTGSPGRDSGGVDDVAFVEVLLDVLTSTYCVDEDRIWATGHSNGGGMTGLLACEATDHLDAFAAVAGAFYLLGECAPTRPVPFLEIHGLADATVPYKGTALLEPIPEVMAGFADRNGCDPDPVVAGTVSTWTGCAAPIVHIALPDQPHKYPDQAAELVWEFFTAQR